MILHGLKQQWNMATIRLILDWINIVRQLKEKTMWFALWYVLCYNWQMRKSDYEWLSLWKWSVFTIFNDTFTFIHICLHSHVGRLPIRVLSLAFSLSFSGLLLICNILLALSHSLFAGDKTSECSKSLVLVHQLLNQIGIVYRNGWCCFDFDKKKTTATQKICWFLNSNQLKCFDDKRKCVEWRKKTNWWNINKWIEVSLKWTQLTILTLM